MEPKTIKIKSNVDEQQLMEDILNCINSGMNKELLVFAMGLHALANKWDADKVIYYLNLIEENGE